MAVGLQADSSVTESALAGQGFYTPRALGSTGPPERGTVRARNHHTRPEPIPGPPAQGRGLPGLPAGRPGTRILLDIAPAGLGC